MADKNEPVPYGIHLVMPGKDVTLCGNPTRILLPDLKGECSMCRAKKEELRGRS